MKLSVILIAACLLSAKAGTIQQDTTNNTANLLSDTVSQEEKPHEDESEQNLSKGNTSTDSSNNENNVKTDADVDDVLEEILNLNDVKSIPSLELDIQLGDVPEISDKDVLLRNAMRNMQEEMMDTAESAIVSAYPIFKRSRQKARRRIAARRAFRRKPFITRRRYYHPYYSFYRPSFIRFY